MHTVTIFPPTLTPAAADILGLLGIGITHATEAKIKATLAESGFSDADVTQALDDLSVDGLITEIRPGDIAVTLRGEDAALALWPTEWEAGWPR